MCLTAQKQVTFTVKKQPSVVEEKKFPRDTFYFGQYELACGAIVDVFPKIADVDIRSIDSIEAGKTLRLFLGSYENAFDTLSAKNLNVELKRKDVLNVTAPDTPGLAEIRLLKKGPKGVYAFVYRRTIRIVATPTKGK